MMCFLATRPKWPIFSICALTVVVRSLQTHRGHECDGSFGLLMISLNNSFFQGGTIGQHSSLIPLKKQELGAEVWILDFL